MLLGDRGIGAGCMRARVKPLPPASPPRRDRHPGRLPAEDRAALHNSRRRPRQRSDGPMRALRPTTPVQTSRRPLRTTSRRPSWTPPIRIRPDLLSPDPGILLKRVGRRGLYWLDVQCGGRRGRVTLSRPAARVPFAGFLAKEDAPTDVPCQWRGIRSGTLCPFLQYRLPDWAARLVVHASPGLSWR